MFKLFQIITVTLGVREKSRLVLKYDYANTKKNSFSFAAFFNNSYFTNNRLTFLLYKTYHFERFYP